jgi:hypothetical protein
MAMLFLLVFMCVVDEEGSYVKKRVNTEVYDHADAAEGNHGGGYWVMALRSGLNQCRSFFLKIISFTNCSKKMSELMMSKSGKKGA